MATTSSAFFNVHDIEKSLKFYRALGFRVTSQTKDEGKLAYADLDFRGAELGLAHIGTNDDAAFVKWVSTPLGAGVVVYFVTTGVDAIHAKAKKAGAVIEFAPMDRPYGRLFSLNDPDGYTLSFVDESRIPRKAAKKPKAKKAAKKSAKPKRR